MHFDFEDLRVIVIKTDKMDFKNFCYLIFDRTTKDGVLVDPAWEVGKIESELIANEVRLRHILLTHHHNDHINLSNHFTTTYKVNAWMSRQEFEFYKPALNNIELIEFTSEIFFGKNSCLPLFTPGHTKGGTCFIIESFFFAGDTIFAEGCGVCDGAGGSSEEMFYSIQNIKNKVYPSAQIFPGHSYGQLPGIPFSQLLVNNIYFNINNLVDFVKFRMRPNQKSLFDFQ